jgi:hypothetical protein
MSVEFIRIILCLHAGGTASQKKIARALARKKTHTHTKLTMTTVDPESAAQYGLAVNQNHGCHKRGASYSIEKKLVEVARVFRSLKQANYDGRPNLTKVDKICRV